MSIAVCISNIGSVDEVMPLCKQSVKYELIYITENNLPFPLPNLDNRMRGKYFKAQAHKFLKHDVIIHLDSSIDVINPDFIQTCVNKLEGKDIVIEQHNQRKNVYEELEYIIDKMKEGDRYLLKRYARQPLYQEYEFYKSKGFPKTYPLYQCSFFARRNSVDSNFIFDNWWDLILRYSNFDQTQMSYALWNNEAKVSSVETKDLFIRMKHPGYNL